MTTEQEHQGVVRERDRSRQIERSDLVDERRRKRLKVLASVVEQKREEGLMRYETMKQRMKQKQTWMTKKRPHEISNG
jgi:hypothetical protein